LVLAMFWSVKTTGEIRWNDRHVLEYLNFFTKGTEDMGTMVSTTFNSYVRFVQVLSWKEQPTDPQPRPRIDGFLVFEFPRVSRTRRTCSSIHLSQYQANAW
jgi:hypothetical protein